eukprot:CCRYP_013644-RA/>CCRYP_013644-RA protein AED:0.04 eAED:0.04 QI:374/0.66/0.75/1/0.66/0.5/4/204/423
MVLAEGNVAIAFGLTIAAGSASMIGASVVFFPALVKLISRRVLAASLGLSAGVMLYFALVDIFYKSVNAWRNSGILADKAYTYATLCVFSGIIAMKIIEVVVHRLGKENGPNRQTVDEDIQITWNENDGQCEVNASKSDHFVPHSVGVYNDPVGELSLWHNMAEKEIKAKQEQVQPVRTSGKDMTIIDEESGGDESPSLSIESDDLNTESNKGAQQINVSPSVQTDSHKVKVISTNTPSDDLGLFRAPAAMQVSAGEAKKRLIKMSLSTATAIGKRRNNYAQLSGGIGSFAFALQDPAAGAVFALAVAIHNIPEGLCVALPIYYATGKRGTAFAWASLAFVSEVIAALLGWVFLAHVVSDQAFAILFGMVGGMLIYISVKELIPTAHRYDPEDTLVTTTIIVGMALMALALSLFSFEVTNELR